MSSEVEICSQALALIGETPIRSLSESNRRATLCKVIYPAARDYLLTKYFWAFAATISPLVQSPEEHPEGFIYFLPVNCLSPKYIIPKGSPPYRWHREQNTIVIRGLDAATQGSMIYLKYVQRETAPSLFSQEFIETLAMDIATRICIPLTQDQKLASSLNAQLRVLKMENAADEANTDEDDVPQADISDTFVDTE